MIDTAVSEGYFSGMQWVAQLGGRVTGSMDSFGGLCRFSGRAMGDIPLSLRRRQDWRLLIEQMYQVGTLSIPVVVITGIFIGAVLAVQTVQQFKSVGLLDRMGPVINLSVFRELGPVLTGMMLAGRVGGGLTAELGTMRVTGQIDAIRAMGVSPIRVLVAPRVLACILLVPLLTLFACVMGIVGGYATSVFLFDANGAEFWQNGRDAVAIFDIAYGPGKCFFFGMAMALICCYKGFHCQPGASGVGRACTEAFVASCMTILVLNFFLGMLFNTLIEMIWGLKAFLAG